MSLQLPRVTVEEADVDTARKIAIHSLREAAEHLEIGDITHGRVLIEAALIWIRDIG